MRDLLASLGGCEISVPVVDGGDGLVRFSLRYATVREALAVITYLNDLRGAEDEQEFNEVWEALAEACAEWLPEKLHRFYFSQTDELLRRANVQDIGALLSAGVKDKKAHVKKRTRVEQAAAERSWFEIIADYADAFRMPPQQVLDEPWPFFIGMCAEILRIQARRRADVMLGYATARSADEKLWKEALDRAGYGRPKPTGTFTPHEGWSEKEQWEKVRRYQQKFFGRTWGKA